MITQEEIEAEPILRAGDLLLKCMEINNISVEDGLTAMTALLVEVYGKDIESLFSSMRRLNISSKKMKRIASERT